MNLEVLIITVIGGIIMFIIKHTKRHRDLGFPETRRRRHGK
jgi:hypothetical protein